MRKQPDDTTIGESYGPIEIDRRTVSKLAGMAGVAVFTPATVRGSNQTQSDQTTFNMNIQPLYDRVLVQSVESDERTDSGIIIPNGAQEVPQEGIVRATGDGPVGDDGGQIPLKVTEGDKVLFAEDAGTEVNIAGEEHLILREGEILAIIND